MIVDYEVDLTVPGEEGYDTIFIGRELENVLIDAINSNKISFDIDKSSVSVDGEEYYISPRYP